jgi:UDP-glucose 4-epimerase
MMGLYGQRVVVTGASGFIGARLCRRALEQGAIVHAVSRQSQTSGPEELRWECADLSDHLATQTLLRRLRPDVVFHLASEVAGSPDRDLVLPMLQGNLISAVNVMLAAGEVECRRLVLAGSMEEPDLGDPNEVARSPYAVAKWAARGYARLFHALYELPVVHLRIFMVYGPGQRDVRKLVPYTTLSLLRGQRPKLTSGARGVDWVYVDDVVDAFIRAAIAPGVDGTSLDIGSGQLVTVRALVARLCDLVDSGVEPVFGAIADRNHAPVRVADPARAASTIGWQAFTPLDRGLERTVDYYRSELDHLPAA